ncbi:MAG TPA: chemotaxis protein CheB [Gemmatimonadaceae bacterium]|nr:chemotaxis protein CheB [Gemmatimonadaceae bacterium]
MKEIAIAVVGASWGGLAALSRLIKDLPREFPIPLAVVQHRSKHADDLLASLLQDLTPLRVVDVEDKEPFEPGTIYIAPANYHLLVDHGHFTLTTDPLVRFSRPSIDVTFVSAGDAYPNATVGVILTGANDDGSRGLKHIVDRGGRGIVQDPETAESRAMPAAALRAVPQAEVLPLDAIAARLVGMTSSPGKKNGAPAR